MFDTIKGDLESGMTYLRDGEKANGYFFLFLAMRIRFKILKYIWIMIHLENCPSM